MVKESGEADTAMQGAEGLSKDFHDRVKLVKTEYVRGESARALAVTTQVSRYCKLLTAPLHSWLGKFGCTTVYQSVAGTL